ncbi:MAG: autotransporter assembly complex protein TamA [Burkholderiales bacterium]|nr:autotransporter assembly complex protein TamA [Burkholderiales bacterium]
MACAALRGVPRMVAYGLCVALALTAPAAYAFDPLVYLGLREAPPPAPTPTTLPFDLTVDTDGASKDVERGLRDASTLAKLRQEPPDTAETLVRVAEADLPKLIDALWGLGYYEASVSFDIAGARLGLGTSIVPAIRAAESYRGRGVVPVRIVARTGPQFTFRRIAIVDVDTGSPFPQEVLPARAVKLEPGQPARAADILAAEARVVDRLRAQGHPFAKVVRRTPVADHPARAFDITLAVEPGPKANLGAITTRGLTTVDPGPVGTFIYARPGDPYSPQALDDIRKSLGKVEILGGVRVREGQALDANGNLPIDIEFTERKPRAIGASVAYSTIDGPELRTYWTHRNLFGGAETLRLEASLFYATPWVGSDDRGVTDFGIDDLGGRFAATFVKPGLWNTRNDLLASALVERNRTVGYTVRHAGGDLGLRHRWSDMASMQAGLRVDRGQTSDPLGQITYTLVGIPVSATFDTTDNLLDPTRGYRFTAAVAPYPAALGSTVNMTVARATGTAYYAIDEDARYVLAGRASLGAIVGPDLDEIPANYRFYAGGGGSVRGYRYQSLSPRINRTPIGGRSIFEASFEARIRITDTIGIVPFVDTGMAFDDAFPEFDNQLQTAVGLGLRYYTAIGPIRVDVAAPINRRPGDRPVALYISIGQAF